MRAAPASPPRIRVLLVDDHVLLRKGLASLLQAEPDFAVVGEAADGLEATAMAADLRPDLILMDLRMPRLNGLEATRRILETQPSARIVMLSMAEDEAAAFQAVKSGARGYFLKTIEPKTLCDRLRGVLGGEASVSRGLATKILREVARAPRRPVEMGSSSRHLSPREQEILALVADGKSNKEIAKSLALTETTIKLNVKRILGKLHLANHGQRALLACQGSATARPQ